MPTVTELALEVASIPHLDLGLEFDLERMREEVSRIDRYDPYHTRHLRSREHYARHWSGVSLVGTKGDPYQDLSELTPDSLRDFHPTAIADLCPYLYSIVLALGKGNRRARVMRIGPDGSLFWHSHCLNHGQSIYQLTVHVPIIVPDGFEWSVMQVEDYRRFTNQDPASRLDMADNLAHRACYEPARATVFNSFHFHNVHNPDPAIARVSMMIYISLHDKLSRDIVEKAVDRYQGPRLAFPSKEVMQRYQYDPSVLNLIAGGQMNH